jgi:hypothetical protein
LKPDGIRPQPAAAAQSTAAQIPAIRFLAARRFPTPLTRRRLALVKGAAAPVGINNLHLFMDIS